MAINYPGPYEVEIEYLTSGMKHKLRLSCVVQGEPAVGTLSSAINIVKRGGALASMDTVVSQFWAFVRPFLNTATSVNSVTLWKYTPNSFERTFITTMGTQLANGSSATAFVLAHQATFTFRSGNGGIFKLQLMESVISQIIRSSLVANATGDAYQKLAAYCISTDSFLIARDDAYVVAPMYLIGGQNEALFRKRYR
jgi:hypothetical protein